MRFLEFLFHQLNVSEDLIPQHFLESVNCYFKRYFPRRKVSIFINGRSDFAQFSWERRRGCHGRHFSDLHDHDLHVNDRDLPSMVTLVLNASPSSHLAGIVPGKDGVGPRAPIGPASVCRGRPRPLAVEGGGCQLEAEEDGDEKEREPHGGCGWNGPVLKSVWRGGGFGLILYSWGGVPTCTVIHKLI